MFDWPSDGKLQLPLMNVDIVRAALITDDTYSKLKIKSTEAGLIIQGPVDAPDKMNTVIELDMEAK